MDAKKRRQLDTTQQFLRNSEEWQTEITKLEKLVAEKNAELAKKNEALALEAALEKVRTRTMAMKNSSELTEAASVLFQQLKSLGGNITATGIGLCEVDNPIGQFWMGSTSGLDLESIIIRHDIDPTHQNMFEAWTRQEKLFIEEKTGKKLQQHYQNMMQEPSFRAKIELAQKVGYQIPTRQIWHTANFKYGFLLITTTEPYQQATILPRFAQVFEQTYTRFLDLQKAEAQATEARIETALERVRTRTMAMHKSEELAKVVKLLYEQLALFGMMDGQSDIEIYLIEETTGVATAWATDLNFNGMIENYQLPLKEFTAMQGEFEQWVNTPINERKHLLITNTSRGKDWEAVLQFFESLPKVRDFAASFREANIQQWTTNHAYFSHGFLAFQAETPATPENLDILQRFARVFEQTYTRFLDLQKAEAQAKEAQIEAALERVRARTMAMHKSEEFSQVVAVMFKEFQQLGLINDIARTMININDEANGDGLMWITRLGGGEISTSFEYNYLENELWEKEYRAYQQVAKNKRKEHKYIVVHEGKAWEALLKFGIEKEIVTPEEVKIIEQQDIRKWIEHIVWFAYGSLVIARESPLSEESFNILQRFTAVFEQTYTRFLDLQKAEAQAREAQIETALERVRSRAMAMRQSTELSEAAELLYQELFKLGLESFSCGYLLNDMDKKVWDIYLTNPGETSFKEFWKCPMEGDAFLKARYQSWKNKEPFHCAILEGEDNRKHHEFIAQFAPWKAEMVDSLPPKLVFNSANFSLGHLLVITAEKMTDELEQTMVRFASVFDLTYRRFLDLEKAEEQNRQLEKVFKENQRLLHSILPEQIAEQIRTGQQTIVKRFEKVSILFADIVGFTVLSEKLPPQKVVDILNGLFSKFDDLTDKYGLEKIKTIGDAYMVASGVPEERENHAYVLFQFAQDMLQAIQAFNQVHNLALAIRIGISSGPVVAGVIGKKKFAYDLWGDTVNTAARMEAYGQASCIQLAPSSYELLKKDFEFKKIPKVDIKGKGKMDVYVWSSAISV